MRLLLDFTIWVLKKKTAIVIGEILALITAFVIAFYVIKPQYSSSVSFFLPSGARSSQISGLMSSMIGLNMDINQDIDPYKIKILFNTVNNKKKFIEYMGLFERYKLEKSKNPLFQAIKILNKNISFEVEEKGSIATTDIISFKITYFDENPDSAFIGINYLYASLDSMIREINISIATQEQQYFFEKINEMYLKLDSLNTDFIVFQEENNLFSMRAQTDATINVYSQLLTNKISLTIDYNELVSKYGNKNSAVIEIKNRMLAIEKVMQSLPLDTNSILLKSLSSMNYYKYFEYLRDIDFYTNFSLFLIGQYEQAHLRVRSELKSLQLIDKPIKPVYKSRPKRILIVFAVMFFYNFALFSVLVSCYGLNIIKKKDYFNAIVKAL
jgi:capsule polysaccharide export protein KpsE/RkpR